MNNLVIYDIETTGLDKNKDQIIQFAAIKVDRQKHKILDRKNIFIKPVGNYSISIQAFFKHGITPQFLEDKPYFKDVAQEIFDFFTGCDILTYNGCSFDNPFLVVEFEKVGIVWDPTNFVNYDSFLTEKNSLKNEPGIDIEISTQKNLIEVNYTFNYNEISDYVKELYKINNPYHVQIKNLESQGYTCK